jgi:arabinan endo-1,5-alpha-L-arabinosidase
MQLPFIHCLALFSGLGLAAAYPSPEPCTGVCSDLQDTTLIKRASDGCYFRFAAFNGIQIATSCSLSGPWADGGKVFPNGILDLRASTNLEWWALDVHNIDGTYHLYYTISNYHNPGEDIDVTSALRVATSSDLTSGSWVDQGSLGVPSNRPNYTRIGANILLDDKLNRSHLAFGSYSFGIYGMQIQLPPLKVDTDFSIRQLIADNNIPSAGGPSDGNKTEGAFQYKRSEDDYYLFYSRGNCCPSEATPLEYVYRIEVCRGPTASGPFYDRDGRDCRSGRETTVVLASHDNYISPGGVGVLDTGEEGLIIFYQYMNTDIGYGLKNFQWGWNHLRFDGDGWPEVF